jgi:hypothetical protein
MGGDDGDDAFSTTFPFINGICGLNRTIQFFLEGHPVVYPYSSAGAIRISYLQSHEQDTNVFAGAVPCASGLIKLPSAELHYDLHISMPSES